MIERLTGNKRLLVVLVFAAAWTLALVYSSISARALYADGAFAVLNSLVSPGRFNDYDAQRTFASFITQAPMLFGQRMGFNSIATYAFLYSLGLFVFPAILMIWALFVLRRQTLLFSLLCFGVCIYGFGVNFINSEANLMFGLVWISVAVIVYDGSAPYLRGYFLPLIGFALLFIYEGMLLTGPFLALLAMIAFKRNGNSLEQIGLVVSTLLYILAAVIGLGGFLAPRDAGNAAGFLSTALGYFNNPQLYIFISGIMAAIVVNSGNRALRVSFGVLCFVFGLIFLLKIISLSGYYSYGVYYYNRSFLVFFMPVILGIVCFIFYFRFSSMSDVALDGNVVVLLLPLLFAVAGDVWGTFQWNRYVKGFCIALYSPLNQLERNKYLQSKGFATGWPWTHPVMSVLLRERGSASIVANDPAAFSWEPFKPQDAPSIRNRGLCEDLHY